MHIAIHKGMEALEWTPLWITAALAFFTTAGLYLPGVGIAYALYRMQGWPKTLCRTVVNLPLVLPPTVLGFYFLLVFSPGAPVGVWLDQWFGLRLVFSFPGILLASMLFSLPFFVNPLLSGMEGMPRSLTEAAFVLGKSPLQALWHVILPTVRPAWIAGLALTFAHAIGEFGVVLLIGGKIPGRTKVASVALYDEVEALRYHNAHLYALVLTVSAMAGLVFLFRGQDGLITRSSS